MIVFRKMFGSPLKLLPSSAKRSKPSIHWNQCIICPIPTSLFHDDGTMRKTSKADLAHQLEQDVAQYNTTCDTGITLLQSINAKRFRTFGEMALDFVKNQISCFQFTSVVVDIFDRYDIQSSIKKAERDRRSKSVFTAFD